MELDGTPVSVADLSALALYNYGHFTSMRVERLRVRGLSHHLDRLVHDCRALFDAELDRDRVKHLVRRLAAASPSPAIVRVTVFAPELDLAHPARPVTPGVLVSTRAASADDLPPVRLKSVPYRRDLPTIKHVGLFGPIHHRRKAQRLGFDDVLFVDAGRRVLEGATWNIGFLDRSGLVVWPQSECLPGVTMRVLREQLGDATTTATVTLPDVPAMRAGFVTNAAIGVRPVASLDGAPLPQDPALIDRLRAAYAAVPAEPL